MRHTQPLRFLSLALISGAALQPPPADAAPGDDALTCAQEVDDLQAWLDGLLDAPGEGAAPGASSIDAALRDARAADERDQDEQLVQIFWDLAEDCPTATVALGLIARSAGDQKMAVMVEHLPPGVLACGCAIDLPSLRAFMWELDGRLNPALSGAPLRAGPAGD